MARQPRRLPTPPRRVWESAGRAAPQKGHPLGVAAALAALPQSTAPRGLPGPEPVPQQTRSGRRRGRALSSCGSRHRLPSVPARAALTASSLGASAGGGGPATLRPKSCRSRAGAATASRSAPSPPPGKPSPQPRPLLAPAGPNPTGQELPASRRPARLPGRGLWGLGSRPRSARAAYPGWRCKQSDFGFASPRPRQNLGEPWKREGVRPAPAVFGGRPGGVLHCLTLFAEHSFLKSYKLT